MFVFCRRYNAANPNTLPTMIQGQAFSINLTIPIMRTSISISCERARQLYFHQIHGDLLKKINFLYAVDELERSKHRFQMFCFDVFK
jgi:hypothetical protein